MIQLTKSELCILQAFHNSGWSSGEWSLDVDKLACRGLLQRDGKVECPLNQLFEDDSRLYRADKVRHNRGMMERRASMHLYRLTRRGEKALRNHVIV
jgi:hypothetical protein